MTPSRYLSPSPLPKKQPHAHSHRWDVAAARSRAVPTAPSPQRGGRSTLGWEAQELCAQPPFGTDRTHSAVPPPPPPASPPCPWLTACQACCREYWVTFPLLQKQTEVPMALADGVAPRGAPGFSQCQHCCWMGSAWQHPHPHCPERDTAVPQWPFPPARLQAEGEAKQSSSPTSG